MKIKIHHLLIILCVPIIVISCNKIRPTGFWNNYKSDLIYVNISDQGPFGGHRVLLWRAKKGEKFNVKDILDFAAKNGWKLIGTEKFSKVEVEKWKSGQTPIFPLTSSGFKPNRLNDLTIEKFPRWINSNITVYKFKTNFITIEPGTDNSTGENGFIIINEDRTEMSLYNLWGE